MSADGKTGFAYHPDYLNIILGPLHPERPDRLWASLEALEGSAFWAELHSIEPTAADSGAGVLCT